MKEKKHYQMIFFLFKAFLIFFDVLSILFILKAITQNGWFFESYMVFVEQIPITQDTLETVIDGNDTKMYTTYQGERVQVYNDKYLLVDHTGKALKPLYLSNGKVILNSIFVNTKDYVCKYDNDRGLLTSYNYLLPNHMIYVHSFDELIERCEEKEKETNEMMPYVAFYTIFLICSISICCSINIKQIINKES